MSVEEYSLKFSLFSKYTPSLVFKPRDQMTRIMTAFANLLEEQCRTTILHTYMNLSRVMVYVQSIEESKPEMRGRCFKRKRTDW